MTKPPLQVTITSGNPDNFAVVVSGPANSGRTTVARVIAEALASAGFTVNNLDPDANKKEGIYPIEKERLKEMAAKKTVRIAVVQSR
jgi:tRNA uridine 5-carbamoylmethylation protein Kti12